MRKELKKKKHIKLQNKKLVKKYPWLLPRNVWHNTVPKDYDYSYTELDAMPDGWRKCFGIMMVDEIDKELRKYHYEHKYRIVQIKEKYGELRWYTNGVPGEVGNIIEKYTTISEHVCLICGKPDVKMTDSGWVMPLCKDCYEKHINCTRSYEDVTSQEDDGMIPNSYTMTRHYKGETSSTTYDISTTVAKIRKKYDKHVQKRISRR